MLTHSGHGSVSALKLDTTQAKAVSPQCARVMIRRITDMARLHYRKGSVGYLCDMHSV